MGSAITRNRYWWYRSIYDDYVAREAKMALVNYNQGIDTGLAAIIWIPHYLYSIILWRDFLQKLDISMIDEFWGIHLNRAFEVSFSHRNYAHEWGPRRNRLTHSMEFEQFEMILENWQDLQDEYTARGKSMLKE